jgi:hypothetical protein
MKRCVKFNNIYYIVRKTLLLFFQVLFHFKDPIANQIKKSKKNKLNFTKLYRYTIRIVFFNAPSLDCQLLLPTINPLYNRYVSQTFHSQVVLNKLKKVFFYRFGNGKIEGRKNKRNVKKSIRIL